MKNIGINKPCSENWNEMSKNEQGAFCQKCASQVHDFTKKSSTEIKQTLLSLVGQNVCGRITSAQEIELNADFNRWMNVQNKKSFQSQLLFALLLIFGLSLFSCENPQTEKNIKSIQKSITKASKELPQTEDEQKDTILSEMKMGFIPPVVVDDFILGDMKMEYPIDLPVEEPIECVKMGEIYSREIYSGGMSYSREYRDFLVQEIKPVSVETDENGNVLPKTFEAKAFPNPAAGQTTVEIAVPTKGLFEITLFDMTGKLIESIFSGELDRGKFRKELDLTNLNPGVYLVNIISSDLKETVRIVKN